MFTQNILLDSLIIGLFLLGIYAFLVLPRQRAFHQRQRLVSQLRLGTDVITYGGMIGKVKKVEAEQGVVTLEVAKGVDVRVISAAISTEYEPQVIAENAQKALKK